MSGLSGRFVFRIPPRLHAAAKKKATQQAISLNELCLRALKAYLSHDISITPLEKPGEQALTERIKRLMGRMLEGIVLFGSIARGDSRDGSDVDMLIVIKREIPLSRDLYSQWDANITDTLLSPHFVHIPKGIEQAGSVWFEAAVDGIVLFDGDRLVHRFLVAVRTAITSGRLERRVAYGHPYWIKNIGEPGHVQ
jgi:predicted nucleotidyltransferase